jgi:hypothetical protein
MRRVKRCGPALVVVALVAALAGCGGGYSDKALASDVSTAFKAKQPLECWHQKGRLQGYFNHGYDRVCGVLRTQPSIYVDVTSEGKKTWCVVSPRPKGVPLCANTG